MSYENLKIELLEKIQKEDRKFDKEMRQEHGAATFCMQCKKNTFAGNRPTWHRYQRCLCSDCGRGYTEFLKQLDCFDKF